MLCKWVTEEADLILNVPRFKVGRIVEKGPGLISTSPAKSSKQKVNGYVLILLTLRYIKPEIL